MNHYQPTKESVVHAVDSNPEYKAPLPQPFQMPRRHLTMWDQQVSHHATRRGSEHQNVFNTLFPYQPIHGTEPLMPTEDSTAQDMYIVEPDEDPMQHLVLLPLGKTGAGKSSLLNLMLGYNEFTAKAAAKSVTDRITERTGIWVIDQVETLITVADTPGFADSMNRDQEFLSVFKEFIQDIGSRIGIDAFMLVFQCNSPTNNIMAILDHFNTMMQQFQPTTWWNHVLLVFTRVDYHPQLKLPTNIVSKKQSITQVLVPEIQRRFNLPFPPKYAFVSSKPPNCSYSKKGQCDCFAASKYHSDQMRTLKSRMNTILIENGGRWIPSID